MTELSLAQIQDILNRGISDHFPALNISILRNIVIEPIEPYLKYLAYEMGFNANVKFGQYDNIFQESVARNGNFLGRDTDCVLVFTKLETLSWDIARNYSGLKREDISNEVQRIRTFVGSVLNGIRSQTDAMILWHSFESPIYPALGVFDAQTSDGQQAVILALNEYLRSILQEKGNAYIVDLNSCLSKLGYKEFYDHRYWHIGRAPYTRKALQEIAQKNFRYIRPLKGKNKKCLVLDCDNVLWGGIIGEDGLAGIQLGKTYPGSCYYEFQQEVLNLYSRGIILALCSKNNLDDVWEVFEKHPDMVLKKEHIATFQINWQDKISNLKKIAEDLNIGLDTLVFIDDSEVEVDLVRTGLPQVEVIHAPQNKAVELRDILASYGGFDTLTISEEDKTRGSLYGTELVRKQLQEQCVDLNKYYRALEMRVDISFANEFSVPRIAQLTQKTNQFNLTTKRYSEVDIKKLSDDKSSDVLFVKVRDKFGDSGIVGVCILKYAENKAIIDTLLLSCRVLGRGIEDVILSGVFKLAKIRGCELMIGEYYATPKNNQVADFYMKKGFEKMDCEIQEQRGMFLCRLDRPAIKEPDYFLEICSEIDHIGA